MRSAHGAPVASAEPAAQPLELAPAEPVEPGPKLSLLDSTERSNSLEIVLGTDSAGVTRSSASLVLDSVLAHPGLRPVAQGHSAASFMVVFQSFQVFIQSILGNSLAAVELLDTTLNICVDRVAILQEPAMLLFLRLKQMEQYFLDATRPCRLKLFLNSGLRGRIMDFNVHGFTSGDRIELSLYPSRGGYNVKKTDNAIPSLLDDRVVTSPRSARGTLFHSKAAAFTPGQRTLPHGITS